MKSNPKPVLNLAACAVLCGMSGARGALIESFESGTLNGWNPGTLNSTVTTVNTDRATDGSFSAANSFAVPSTFAGYTVAGIIDRDPRAFLDATAITLTLDVYSDWTNPQGWGVYDNSMNLILNYQGGYQVLASASGSLSNGSFQTISFDLSPWAATITDSGLSYSQLSIAWKLGTFSDDGMDNGTQTFAIDNINVTSVPEPSSAVFLGAMGALALLYRRRA